MKKLTLGLVAVAAVCLIGAPSAAHAAEPAEVTLRWILPNGGTPENVTWPQPPASEVNLAAVPCGTGVWIQVDTGPNDERAAGFTHPDSPAGESLAKGEDYGWVQYWDFEWWQAPACAPTLVTPVTPTVTVTGQCVDETWTEVATVTVPYVENGRYDVGNGYVPGGFEFPFPQGSELTIPFQTAEGSFALGEAADWRIENGTAYTTLTRPYIEPADCAIPPLTPEEPVAERPPVTEDEPELALVQAGLMLAATGPDEDALGLIGFGFGALIIGAGAYCADRIKNGARR